MQDNFLRSFEELRIDAYRQGFEESSSTGAANPGSPPAAQLRKGSGLNRHFDRDRVADLQNKGIQGGIPEREMGGVLSVVSAASTSFGGGRLSAPESNGGQDHSSCEPRPRRGSR